MKIKNIALATLVTIIATAFAVVPTQAFFFDGADSFDLEAIRIQTLIEEANEEIAEVMEFAAIQISIIARTYGQMEIIAKRTEERVYKIVDVLEEEIGPIKFKAYYITVCNDWVQRCIVFDPVFISTSGG